MMNTDNPTEEQLHQQLKEHRREYWQQYYLKNREKVLQRCRERSKLWYEHNKEQASADNKVYYQKNADQTRACRMERYWNLEKIRCKKFSPKKFSPSLVSFKLNVTLTFD